MKKELLEYIIRETVSQLLEVGAIEDPTVGAPAPPESTGQGTQGTADQPEMPKTDPQAPTPFFASQPKGVWFVDPKKPKPTQLKFGGTDPRSIESTIYQTAARSGGPNIQTSNLGMKNMVNKTLQNPAGPPVFLYVGKPDPDSESLTVMGAPDYETAKQGAENAVGASAERGITSISSDPAEPEGMVQNWQTKQAGGKTLAPDIDESGNFHNMISSMIREALSEIK